MGPPFDDTGKFSFDKYPFYYMCFENKSEMPIEIQLCISFQYTDAEKAERRVANRARMGAAFRNRFGIGPPPLRTIQVKVRKMWDKKEVVMKGIAKRNRNVCDGFEDKDFDRRWTNADERN